VSLRNFPIAKKYGGAPADLGVCIREFFGTAGICHRIIQTGRALKPGIDTHISDGHCLGCLSRSEVANRKRFGGFARTEVPNRKGLGCFTGSEVPQCVRFGGFPWAKVMDGKRLGNFSRTKISNDSAFFRAIDNALYSAPLSSADDIPGCSNNSATDRHCFLAEKPSSREESPSSESTHFECALQY
jgi:hypothetical protein